jgi:dTDP-4-dehydrorhamnose 3,5-epimerase
MKIEQTALAGVLILTPTIHQDDRGAFWETWNQIRMSDAGLPSAWVQDNFSVSKKNVLRGIHYQIDRPQGKLVHVVYGAVLDVVVDLRRSSSTFGKHVSVELDESSVRTLWIPGGFGHAFLALTDKVGFAYKVTEYYSRDGERTIAWNDADLGIPWPITSEDAVISDKDRRGIAFRNAQVFP